MADSWGVGVSGVVSFAGGSAGGIRCWRRSAFGSGGVRRSVLAAFDLEFDLEFHFNFLEI